MKFPQQVVKSPRSTLRRSLGHLWAVMLPLYVFTVAALDPSEVTHFQYFQFVSAMRHPAPKYWRNGRYAAGRDNDPLVLASWHDAVAYCRWVGTRLPTVDELQSTCEAGRLKKRGDIWECTATDVETGGQPFKALCGPGNSCDCFDRYHPDWKNEVKGFRCYGGKRFSRSVACRQSPRPPPTLRFRRTATVRRFPKAYIGKSRP